MWQSPGQRSKPNSTPGKRREKLRRVIHIKRINAHIELPHVDGTPAIASDVRLVLNDLSTKGVGLYSSSPLNPGQEITLTITEPSIIKIRSKVVWCQEHAANSHILSVQSFGYRIGLEFLVDKSQEMQLVAFCEEVFRNILPITRPTAAP